MWTDVTDDITELTTTGAITISRINPEGQSQDTSPQSTVRSSPNVQKYFKAYTTVGTGVSNNCSKTSVSPNDDITLENISPDFCQARDPEIHEEIPGGQRRSDMQLIDFTENDVDEPKPNQTQKLLERSDAQCKILEEENSKLKAELKGLKGNLELMKSDSEGLGNEVKRSMKCKVAVTDFRVDDLVLLYKPAANDTKSTGIKGIGKYKLWVHPNENMLVEVDGNSLDEAYYYARVKKIENGVVKSVTLVFQETIFHN
jgi:hypothetical protein